MWESDLITIVIVYYILLVLYKTYIIPVTCTCNNNVDNRHYVVEK